MIFFESGFGSDNNMCYMICTFCINLKNETINLLIISPAILFDKFDSKRKSIDD